MRYVFGAALAAVILCGCGEAKITAECTLNGFGVGQCVFHNAGTAEGNRTAIVTVNRGALGELREVVHSGLVPAGDVRERKVTVAGMARLCRPLYESGHHVRWTDVCSLVVEYQDEQ